MSTSSGYSQNPLKDYAWKYRIIAYSINDPQDLAGLEEQARLHEADIFERDIRFIPLNRTASLNKELQISLSEEEKKNLRKRLKPAEKDTELILIGKDSGVKARLDLVNLVTFFEAIDQMPMRRAEMDN